MAEPKNESVRSALPLRPETTNGLPNEGSRVDSAQSPLASRTPALPLRRSPPASPPGTGPRAESTVVPSRFPPSVPRPVNASPTSQPLPKPAGALPPLSEPVTSAPGASENFAGPSVQPGPRKETARIAILPGQALAAALPQSAPIFAAPSKAIDAFDSIPRWFCWGLLGLSALIFIIQICNYALS